MFYIRSDGLSINEWAKKKKVPYQTIYMAIQRGLSIEEACERALKRKGKKDSHTKYYVGKHTLRAYCLKNGLNYPKIYRYIRNGMTIEKAMRIAK